ncbi:hypothetical protein XENOCAPTIV_010475 [Xenoophorus captivus]|uniref:Uncharacterized protein n=1 Tax=Xenoophorus captivus TaxID=1517983 RepID=A0ABV0RUT7_9TELE
MCSPSTRTDACLRRDNNLSSSERFEKTYQQFSSLTPNQAEGTRSTSYDRFFPPVCAWVCCAAPRRGQKLGAKNRKTNFSDAATPLKLDSFFVASGETMGTFCSV